MCVVLKLNPRKYPVNLDRQGTPLTDTPRVPHRLRTHPGPPEEGALLRIVSSKCPANQQESLSGVKDFALILDGVLRDGGDT